MLRAFFPVAIYSPLLLLAHLQSVRARADKAVKRMGIVNLNTSGPTEAQRAEAEAEAAAEAADAEVLADVQQFGLVVGFLKLGAKEAMTIHSDDSIDLMLCIKHGEKRCSLRAPVAARVLSALCPRQMQATGRWQRRSSRG